jgi:hypothetical protein
MKKRMLELLDQARAEVESGEAVGILIVPLLSGSRFDVRYTGEITNVQLAGLLGRAWLDAQEKL